MSGPELLGASVGSAKSYRQKDAPQHRLFVQPPTMAVASAGTVQHLFSTLTVYKGRSYSRLSTIGGYIEYELGVMEVGTWNFVLWVVKGRNKGIMQVTTPDGTVRANVDLYADANDAPFSQYYPVVIPNLTDQRRVRIAVTGKNAAAGAQQVDVCLMLGRRAAA